jgi:hypothetical protein
LRPVRVGISGVSNTPSFTSLAGEAGGDSSTATSTAGSVKTSQYVVSVTVGLRHTIALTSSQLLFGWGMVNLTNPTIPAEAATSDEIEAELAASILNTTSHRSGPLSTNSSARVADDKSPLRGGSSRRFSVFNDAASSSELYLRPTQIRYRYGGANPFSEGRFLSLQGSSSSSLGFVTVDAEVPPPSAGLNTSTDFSSKKSPTAKPVPGAMSASGSGRLRSANLFGSPSGARDGNDSASESGRSTGASVSSSGRKAGLAAKNSPVKKPFNPFLKDYVKPDPKVIF